MLEFLQFILGVFVVVYEGQHAVKFTLGRAGAVVGPGVHWKWPVVQKYKVADTRHTTLDLEPQVIQLADDLVYEVDCKVLYQIVNLRKALIEIDDLVTGLKNRVVLAVQKVVGACNRDSIRDTQGMLEAIVEALGPVEEQWGVRILQLGFSNISPSTTTLEITQLELLANEKQTLYNRFRAQGLSEEASVALVTGAVVAVHPPEAVPSLAQQRREEAALTRALRDAAKEGRRTAMGDKDDESQAADELKAEEQRE
jgi:regulator of protease activity HflC (stomatin/prohibitin superfamily)